MPSGVGGSQYRKTFQKAGIPFMIAMAIAIVLISMTDFSIMLDYQRYQFDNAAFDSARNGDEKHRN